MWNILTLAISCAALLISGASAYYSYWRVVDRVQAVITAKAKIIVHLQDGKIGVDYEPRVTMINSGTRAAAISGFRLDVMENQETCSGRRRTSFELEPFVVTAGEVDIKEPLPTGSLIISVRDLSAAPTLLFCLSALVTTPGSSKPQLAHSSFELSFGKPVATSLDVNIPLTLAAK